MNNYYLYLNKKTNDLDNYFHSLIIRNSKSKNILTDIFEYTGDLEINSIEELPNIHTENGQIYELGGIYDSIDKVVFGDHYSTSHYIAYCSMKKDSNSHIKNVETSIDFISKTNVNYKYGSWNPHRDFNNLANIIIYKNSKNFLNKDFLNTLKCSIKKTKVNFRNRATNWILMRCLFYKLRYLEFGNKLDFIKYKMTLREAMNRQLNDGCIEDKKGKSDPIQYHVYSLILFMKIYQLEKGEKLKKIIELGLEYFVRFFNYEGNFNYKGRGQQQIFGYISGVYALLFALNNDLIINKTRYKDALIALLNYMKRFLDKEQIPLTFNEFASEEKVGWYDYHHYSVYLAFFLLWTEISLQEFGSTLKEIDVNDMDFENSLQLDNNYIFNRSQVYIKTNKFFYINISGKTGEYLSDFGFSFDNLNINNYGDLITCPGGPSLRRYGKVNIMKNVEFNFYTPIIFIKDSYYYNPILESESIGLDSSLNKSNIKLILKSKIVNIERTIQVNENKILVIDEIIKNEIRNADEYNVFLNIPLTGDDWITDGNEIYNKKVSLQFMSNNSKVNCYINRKMKNAAGLVSIVMTSPEKLKNNSKYSTTITILN